MTICEKCQHSARLTLSNVSLYCHNYPLANGEPISDIYACTKLPIMVHDLYCFGYAIDECSLFTERKGD